MDSMVTNFTMSFSGRYLITSDLKNKMTLFDLLEGEVLNEFVVPEKNTLK